MRSPFNPDTGSLADPSWTPGRGLGLWSFLPDAYDDPEWAADAAHGALTNEYGLRATYEEISEIDDSGGQIEPTRSLA